MIEEGPEHGIALSQTHPCLPEEDKGSQNLVHSLLVLQLLQPAEMHQDLLHLRFQVFWQVQCPSAGHVHYYCAVLGRVYRLTQDLLLPDGMLLGGLLPEGQLGR